MHRLIVLACLWRQAAPALQYHVDIDDGSHATIAYDAGNATAAARAFVAEFDIQTHGTCEDAACVAELVEAELDAFASREIAVLVVDACESALDARRPVRYRTAPKKMHEERKPPNGRAEDAKREKFCCNAENTPN